MNEIAGIPYTEAQFDKNGRGAGDVILPPGVTDLFVISHGWNNNKSKAEDLYRELFENFVAVAEPDEVAERHFAIVGVIWPSKEYDPSIAVSGAGGAEEGAAGFGSGDASSVAALEKKLDELKETFNEPQQIKLLDEAKALLPDLEEKATPRLEFVRHPL